MDGFEGVRGLVADADSLQRPDRESIEVLRARFPDLPADYLGFLQQVGHGDLGSLAIYSEPASPFEIFPADRARALSAVVIFGDDMQGFCYGFDLSQGCRVVEIDPRGRVDRDLEPDFGTFLRSFLQSGIRSALVGQLVSPRGAVGLRGEVALDWGTQLLVRLRRSPFFPALCACQASVEVQLGGRVLMLHLEASKLRLAARVPDERADLLLSLPEDYLENGSTVGVQVTPHGESASPLHATAERLLLRTLEGTGPRSDEEVAELSYGPYFGFADPQLLWRCGEGTVSLLGFAWQSRHCLAAISCGLARLVPDHPFELVVLIANDHRQPSILGEVETWCRYCVSERTSLGFGDWLQVPVPPIPTTNFAGFLVLPPLSLPGEVATGAGAVPLCLLLPVTAEELLEAKATSAIDVAQRLHEEQGVLDLR